MFVRSASNSRVDWIDTPAPAVPRLCRRPHARLSHALRLDLNEQRYVWRSRSCFRVVGSALSRSQVRLAHQKNAGFCKRLPYHRKGATETRRRKTPAICKKFVSVEIVLRLHVPQSPEMCAGIWARPECQNVIHIRDLFRGGEGGIRTPDTVTRMPHFECGAFNHSATSPWPQRRKHPCRSAGMYPTRDG